MKSTPLDIEQLLFTAPELAFGELTPTAAIELLLALLLVKRVADLASVDEADTLVADMSCGQRPDAKIRIDETFQWDRLLATTDMQRDLEKLIRTLERLNPHTLRGLEQAINLPSYAENVIHRYVHELQRYSLALVSPENLGSIVDGALNRLSTAHGHGHKIYGLPDAVQRILSGLTSLLQPKSVADPSCATGGMLASVATGRLRQRLVIAGQEPRRQAWSFCKISLLLRGYVDARIEMGDPLRDPRLRDDKRLRTYDLVVTNPPAMHSDWGVESAAIDPYGRFPYGVPPRSSADFAYVQNALAHANQKGVVAVLMTSGFLFRGGAEAEIRRSILNADLVDTIIQLPGNLLYQTTLPVVLVIFTKTKTANRQGKVLFIDARQEAVQLDRRRKTLSEEGVAKILQTYETFIDKEGFSKVATLAEIEATNNVLTVPRYVRVEAEIEQVSIPEEREKLASLERNRDLLEAELDGILSGFHPGDRE